ATWPPPTRTTSRPVRFRKTGNNVGIRCRKNKKTRKLPGAAGAVVSDVLSEVTSCIVASTCLDRHPVALVSHATTTAETAHRSRNHGFLSIRAKPLLRQGIERRRD